MSRLILQKGAWKRFTRYRCHTVWIPVSKGVYLRLSCLLHSRASIPIDVGHGDLHARNKPKFFSSNPPFSVCQWARKWALCIIFQQKLFQKKKTSASNHFLTNSQQIVYFDMLLPSQHHAACGAGILYIGSTKHSWILTVSWKQRFY